MSDPKSACDAVEAAQAEHESAMAGTATFNRMLVLGAHGLSHDAVIRRMAELREQRRAAYEKFEKAMGAYRVALEAQYASSGRFLTE